MPGENLAGAALDMARTVVRRAERLAVAAELPKASAVVPYLNRLSDLCWLLARAVEREHLTARQAPPKRTRTFAPPGLERQHASRRAMMARMNVEPSIARPLPPGSAPPATSSSRDWCRPRAGSEIDRAQCELRSFAGKAGEALVERDGGGFAGARRERGSGEPFSRRPCARRPRRSPAPLLVPVCLSRARHGCRRAASALPPPSKWRWKGSGARRTVSPGTGARSGRRAECCHRRRGGVRRGALRTGHCAVGVAVADAVALARDLANTPAADITPSRWRRSPARVAAERRSPDPQRPRRGADPCRAPRRPLGVCASGSSEPPRLIKLTYEPAGAVDGGGAYRRRSSARGSPSTPAGSRSRAAKA